MNRVAAQRHPIHHVNQLRLVVGRGKDDVGGVSTYCLRSTRCYCCTNKYIYSVYCFNYVSRKSNICCSKKK